APPPVSIPPARPVATADPTAVESAEPPTATTSSPPPSATEQATARVSPLRPAGAAARTPRPVAPELEAVKPATTQQVSVGAPPRSPTPGNASPTPSEVDPFSRLQHK